VQGGDVMMVTVVVVIVLVVVDGFVAKSFGAERRQLIAGAYRTPAEVKIKRHEARPFGGTMVESLSSPWG